MPVSNKTFLSKVAQFFSSTFVGVGMAVFAMVGMVVTTANDTRAEGGRASAVVPVQFQFQVASTLPVTAAGGEGTLAEAEAEVKAKHAEATAPSAWIARRSFAASFRSQEQNEEVFGLSKVAFPLLVRDLTTGLQKQPSKVMSGRAVGVR